MDLKLIGPSALITGSTSGIGSAVARALAREGATVIVHGRSEARARAVTSTIAEAGGLAHYAPGDLNREADARAAIAQALNALDQIDIGK
ncbi:MAG: family oxidoreductase [Rhodospirillales bacterium]|nr:family oxidoreductase [Rhodospirillales bacterium]